MTGAVQISRRERKPQPILSIRARLMLLALIAVVPVMLDRVQSLETTRSERIGAAQSEAADLARRGAEAHAEAIASARALLQVASRTEIVLKGTQGDCTPLIRATAGLTWLRSLSLTAPDGRVRCSTEPRLLGADLSERTYFRKAVVSRAFAISDYLIGRASGEPTIVAAQPSVGDDGILRGMLVASLDLRWVERLTGAVERHSGASVALIDGSGTLIAHYPAVPGIVGRSVFDRPFVRDMMARDDGVSTADGLDGIRRIVAFMRVPSTDSRLAIGLDERGMLSSIESDIGWAYLKLAAFALIALFAAWIGGERLIVEPIRELVTATTRFGRGDLDSKISRDGWVAEFVPLATAFDDMTRTLAQRDRELRAANRHFEELASVDGLCALANRRAFDSRIDTEWQGAMAGGRPLGLLLFDVDHFKSFNDTRGHLEGDNCLRLVGEALASIATGAGDFAARYGGDEFALLLPGADEAQAIAVGERLRRAVHAMAETPAGPGRSRVTVSVGAASLVPLPGDRPEALVAAADMGLYAAKHRGRDMVVGYAGVALAAAG